MLCQKACDVPFGITAIVSAAGSVLVRVRLQAAANSSSATAARLVRVISVEPPESLRGPAEHGVLLVRGTRHNVLDDSVQRSLVRCGDQTHRPVRANHQPIRAERIERDVEIRPEIVSRPRVPVRFGNQARQFRVHVRVRSKSANIFFHGRRSRPRIFGFAR